MSNLDSRINIALIGTGPTSLAVLLALVENSDEVNITIFEAATDDIETDIWEFGRLSKAKKINNSNLSPKVEQLGKNFRAPIFSHGGWSAFWGATFMPVSNNDLMNYTKDLPDLQYSFKKIATEVDHLADYDEMIENFPLYGLPNPRGEISPVCTSILEKVRIKKSSDRSYWVTKSRLAISKIGKSEAVNCTLKGTCLEGCPNGVIFNSSRKISDLAKKHSIKIVSGTQITKFINVSDGVELFATNSTKTELHVGTFDAVFIAGGPIGQSLIIQNSLNSRPLFSKETPMSIVPALFFGKLAKIDTNVKKITLSELFIFYVSIKGKIESAAQVYSLNSDIVKNLGWLKFFVNKLLRNRGLIFMWFNKSDKNSFVALNLPESNSKRIKRSLCTSRWLQYFSFARKNFSMRILVPPLNLFRSKPGTSYHFGGLFEISNDGLEYSRIIERDGSIVGGEHSNILVLGAAQLDNPIPGPITFTTMAFAHSATRKFISQ